MDTNTFTNIVDQVEPDQWIIPSAWNEPFVSPNIWDCLDACEGKRVLLYTNASLLTIEDIYRIHQSPHIKKVSVSINGGTAEDYESVMKGLSFDEAIENTRFLIGWAQSSGRNPDLEVDIMAWFTPETKDRVRQLDKIFPGTSVTAYPFFNVRGLVNLPGSCCAGAESITGPCARPLFYMAIQYNGDVVPCCNDINSEYVVGSTAKESLKDLWVDEKLTDLRKMHLAGNIPAMCRKCCAHSRSHTHFKHYAELWKELMEATE
jgi:radical SAM protein with 4Fe4S-binding SPASM domain